MRSPRYLAIGVVALLSAMLAGQYLAPPTTAPSEAPTTVTARTTGADRTASAPPLFDGIEEQIAAISTAASELRRVPETAPLAPAAAEEAPTQVSAPTLEPPTDGIVTASRAIEAVPAMQEVAAPDPAQRPAYNELAPPVVTAQTAVVLDENSMAVLYGKGEHHRRAPASLTKIVTAALAVQLGNPADRVHNGIDAREMPGSSLMGILPGDEFTLEDLLYGLMLMSGNDAARSIAEHVAGSEALFVHWMNTLVERLGLENSHFTDPHGLGGPDHYSSAYDLAVLARYGMQFDLFRSLANARTWEARGSRAISMTNLNPFMDVYPGGDGVKTGFTYEAGPTFIGSAVRDGRRLYVVLLDSQDRFGEAGALLNWAFDAYRW